MKTILILIAVIAIAGCEVRSDCKAFRVTIEKVYDETCTMQSEDPTCRVELSNGIRLNIDAPIMKDDILVGCQRPGEVLVRLWRAETPHRMGLNTVGVYRN